MNFLINLLMNLATLYLIIFVVMFVICLIISFTFHEETKEKISSNPFTIILMSFITSLFWILFFPKLINGFIKRQK